MQAHGALAGASDNSPATDSPRGLRWGKHLFCLQPPTRASHWLNTVGNADTDEGPIKHNEIGTCPWPSWFLLQVPRWPSACPEPSIFTGLMARCCPGKRGWAVQCTVGVGGQGWSLEKSSCS